jgi:hypothetical protein
VTIRPKYETSSRHNKTTRPNKAMRKAAYETAAHRSGGFCEGCGGQATQMHHRLYRSRGGEDEPQNLLHLCVSCHGRAHTGEGERLGWSVRSGFDPGEVPVVCPDGVERKLMEDGSLWAVITDRKEG